MSRTPVPRNKRESRAFSLVIVGGGLATAGVIGFFLAVFGVVGFGGPILLLVLAAVCGLLFRRTVS